MQDSLSHFFFLRGQAKWLGRETGQMLAEPILDIGDIGALFAGILF